MKSRALRYLTTGLTLCAAGTESLAAAQNTLSGPTLTSGTATHLQGVYSSRSNPAMAAANADIPGSKDHAVLFSVGAGLEYGEVDELFELIDEVSQQLRALNGESSGGDNGGDSGIPGLPDEPVTIPENPTLDDIIDANPQFEEWINAVAAQTAFLASSLAIVQAEAYAKAFVETEVPILITNDLWGGSLEVAFNLSGTSKAYGIVDDFDFDRDEALAQIDQARNLAPTDPATTFVLSDDLELTVDPQNGTTRLRMTNDSLLLTKAAEIGQFSVGYGRETLASEHGTLYTGVKAKLLRVGLAQIDVRLGDLTDSEKLFEDIDNADFHYDTDFSFDLGALWVASNYSVGATIRDPLSPEFKFPDIDRTKYRKRAIADEVQSQSYWKMEAQGEVEASLYTSSRRWVLNALVELNGVETPVGDEYQWMQLGGAYQSSGFWMPDFRIGYRANVVDNEMQYLSLGTTLFSFLNIDLSSALNTTEIDDTTLPRGGNLSIGLQFAF